MQEFNCFVDVYFFYPYLLLPRTGTMPTFFTLLIFHSVIPGRNFRGLHVYCHVCILFSWTGTVSAFLTVRMCPSVTAYTAILCFIMPNFFIPVYFFEVCCGCVVYPFSRLKYLVWLHHRQEFKVLYIRTFHTCLLFQGLVPCLPFYSENFSFFSAYAGILCFVYVLFFRACLYFSRIDTLSTFFSAQTISLFYTIGMKLRLFHVFFQPVCCLLRLVPCLHFSQSKCFVLCYV